VLVFLCGPYLSLKPVSNANTACFERPALNGMQCSYSSPVSKNLRYFLERLAATSCHIVESVEWRVRRCLNTRLEVVSSSLGSLLYAFFFIVILKVH